MLLVLVSEEVKGTPVAVEPTLSTCLRRAGHGGGKDENRGGGLNETFEKHRTPLQVWAAAGAFRLQQAGNCAFSPSKPISQP